MKNKTTPKAVTPSANIVGSSTCTAVRSKSNYNYNSISPLSSKKQRSCVRDNCSSSGDSDIVLPLKKRRKKDVITVVAIAAAPTASTDADLKGFFEDLEEDTVVGAVDPTHTGFENMATAAVDVNAVDNIGHNHEAPVAVDNHKKKNKTNKKKKVKKSKKIHQRHYESGEDTTFVNFLKTPSPRYHGTRDNVMSSPPPLSHYLQQKQDPHRHLQYQHQDEQDTTGPQTGPVAQSESPPNSSPSQSLLTVNFLMTPSPPPIEEETPRANNLSSSSLSSTLSSSPFKKSKRSPDDGVRMLSWAARAVESPAFKQQEHNTPIGGSTHGKTTTRFVSFVDTVGYSPITIPSVGSTLAAEVINRYCSPVKKRSFNNTFNSTTTVTTNNNDVVGPSPLFGPSPLCFQNYQPHTDVELELLRNCLEDVFAATSSTDSSSSLPPLHSLTNMAGGGGGDWDSTIDTPLAS